MVKYPMCDGVQKVGFSSAAISKCHERILDFKVETGEMQCAFLQPRANGSTVSLDGLTLKNHACVLTSPLVYHNGKVFISKKKSWEEIQLNAQAAHIHSPTKFEPTIDIFYRFFNYRNFDQWRSALRLCWPVSRFRHYSQCVHYGWPSSVAWKQLFG